MGEKGWSLDLVGKGRYGWKRCLRAQHLQHVWGFTQLTAIIHTHKFTALPQQKSKAIHLKDFRQLEARGLGLVWLFPNVPGFYWSPPLRCLKSQTETQDFVNDTCLTRNHLFVQSLQIYVNRHKHCRNLAHKINWYFKQNKRQSPPEPDHTLDVVSLHTIHISGYFILLSDLGIDNKGSRKMY